MSSKVSVIIPSRNEQFLPRTVADILAKAAGEIEVIAVLDGYWPVDADNSLLLPDDKRLQIIHFGKPRGMRAAINAAAGIATGQYLMKTDAHCMFAEGFDEALKADCEDNWIVVPRRYSLDAELWERREKEPIDYHYLDCPMTNPEYFQFHGVVWNQRGRERREDPQYDIDDTMSWQGSMWFMSRKHWDRLGGMSEEGYGTFSQEPQEIGLKTQLGGGRLVVNKRTWYAHLHKGKQYGRGYSVSKGGIVAGHKYSAEYWMANSWPGRIHDIEWLIERYWPVPRWPDNWMELLEEWRVGHAGLYRAEV